MKAFALAAAAALMVGQAEAAIVTYTYTGQQMYLYPDVGDPTTPWGKLFGSFTIDESVLPGGNLAGAKIELYTYEYEATYKVTDATGAVFSETFTIGWDGLPDWSRAGIVSYDFILFYSPIEYWSHYEIQFTDNLLVEHWWGGTTLGGSHDPVSFGPDGFDYSMDAASAGPGTWAVEVTPAPVPLPAAAPLLLAGTAALFALRRRSHRVG